MLSFEALTPEARALAPELCANLAGTEFILAGGTGLALQLGHRISVDFDWFCQPRVFPVGLAERLSALKHPIILLQDRADTVECLLANVRCTFIAFSPTFGLSAERLHGMPIASIEDIGAMKLIAVSQRGAKKDFYDLYAILQEQPLDRLAGRLRAMYTQPRPNPAHIAKSLVYFKDADQEPEPRLLRPTAWQTVTQFFTEHIKTHTMILMETLA
ncbi:MAG: nucleotidyl transferase AbiEii/AbiGii toxin family protein [Nitrospira sp.]|nr:nucleotidyl transferase AbiEii/AbiGii toxin family protein [Nitrospira sp.]